MGTVFPIVKQIIRAGWVEEGKRVRIPRGRSPILLQPSRRLLVYGVALHQRMALLGLVNLEGYVLEQRSIALPLDQKLAADIVADELKQLAKSRPNGSMYAAGLCVTPASHADERFQAATNIAKHLRFVLGVPVKIGSALHGTVLHEMTLHNPHQIRSVVLLHISHDVTGAIWVNGEFLNEDVAHLGHICINPQGEICQCGRYGCWSLYASDDAALAAFRSASGNRELRKIEELYQLFADGDPAAIAAVKIQEEGVAAGIRTLARILAPDLCIVQGACAGIWQHLSTRVKKEIEEALGEHKPVHLISVQPGDLSYLKAAAALGWRSMDFIDRLSDARRNSKMNVH
jgi:predicted NBD/HSP70 family sugar kinase